MVLFTVISSALKVDYFVGIFHPLKENIMTLEEYLSNILKISQVKKTIVERLWNEGAEFPRGWVESTDLLKLTNQKYFDRRIRELRDQDGCDIESGKYEGKDAYRLVSELLRKANPRGYLTNIQKKQLMLDFNRMCAVCGQSMDNEGMVLQADHRVPLSRYGSHDKSNWQPLCVECNIAKRRTCAGCTLDCQKCSWAFPERLGRRIVVQIPVELHTKLSALAENKNTDVPTIILEAVSLYLENSKI